MGHLEEYGGLVSDRNEAGRMSRWGPKGNANLDGLAEEGVESAGREIHGYHVRLGHIEFQGPCSGPVPV
ncbi:hypothetical protein SERLA73DRAFT_175339 [Serpula lacrymans var. lacrymans S7.3]|uniref:Uncharacterized protein n=2 Tax=Serpula lacrymans var. lacrymans TaxID=341189 RepID=F8PJA4_SERL3|nr:uncharacterized protein SERLADRAFT_457555 [Serpula lacrymans var. lacrymans S7.9]EGO03729.1 hypothetical protein SERLA73DRAFT_175339 [Serpula lacrymans var. lacrymans S7.3]EGO29595.1 hypothetical protein SERLADRAFT_457555 [Serpula lacrymans var. lacrymans S7.9]